jgi:hypothetical protein
VIVSPTLTKLRYKPGMKVSLHDAPAGFEAQVLAAKDITRASARAKDVDIVQAFFTRKSHLGRSFSKLKAALGPRGILWLCYPKGGALDTDLNRDVIRTMAKTAGLETVALVSIDDVWSALRVKCA